MSLTASAGAESAHRVGEYTREATTTNGRTCHDLDQRIRNAVEERSRHDKLPYGTLPRLLLAWVCTEAVRTGRRELVLGRSLAEFMRQIGITNDSGGRRGDRTRLPKLTRSSRRGSMIRMSASWRGCSRCAVCRARTQETETGTFAGTARLRSS